MQYSVEISENSIGIDFPFEYRNYASQIVRNIRFVDSVYFEKRKVSDNIEATGKLAKNLSKYIREH